MWGMPSVWIPETRFRNKSTTDSPAGWLEGSNTGDKTGREAAAASATVRKSAPAPSEAFPRHAKAPAKTPGFRRGAVLRLDSRE